MELQLKNVGMIKEANVKIDGLTVIAGENDTGKSTVGKALYLSVENFNNQDTTNPSLKFLNIYNALFENSIINATIIFKYKRLSFEIGIQNSSFNFNTISKLSTDIKFNSIFIETPIVWSFIDFFRDIAQLESQFNVKLDYPYLMKDLAFKISIKSSNSNFINIKEKVTNLMGGEFKKDDLGKFYFDKQGKRIEIVNTATGIKSFGILQILSQNGWLSKDTILIFDEPEVHLHPKWQLEMAKVIVKLVKNGVRVLVTSHSPYIIQSLIKYARDENLVENSNFYLAQKIKDNVIIENVNEDLNKIFTLLAKPMNEVFEL